ncbi:MAG: type 1 glutamine amidotransferase [Thermodesulfovibrionia bacterium]|nr:type 1 glutamine amidotransferase [Thermodesulfovibrionia bacterium]
MSVLICKNIETEGPGTIKDYLRLKNIPYKIVELSTGEDLPNSDNFNTLIMMGGPMSVNEDEIYPYIKEEEKLVRDFISKRKKILGVCLGAQIMAKALGTNVYAGPQKEIGWYDIELTGEGLRDSYMRNLALHPKVRDIWKRFKVFHWHGETFDIPQGAVRLASSILYPNQAFRYGKDAYAFQFHIEVRKEMILEWLKDETDFERIGKETNTFFEEYIGRAENFYKGFFL